MRAKPPGDRCKVLAVGPLTDGDGDGSALLDIPGPLYDGIICPVRGALSFRQYTSKLLVCPGIRPTGSPADNHVNPVTPAEAKAAGADYIVVGRPIIDALDTVVSARAIIEELR